MDILIAFLVMFGIAVVVGILLLLCSHFFAVKENPLKRQVRECLPGINCGACGYKGCDDYASAIAEDGARPNLCIPGGQEVADQIGEILDIKVEPFEDVNAFVACNGNCDAAVKIADYEGVQTCSAASMLYGGTNACRFGCLGFGDCAAVCPASAICLKDGIAHVDSSLCIGCGLCQTVCPKHVISMLPQDAKVVVMCSNEDKGADARKACKNPCIGCKKCEKVCPHGAVTVVNNLAKIDYAKCEGCGACAEACPTGSMKKVFFPNLTEPFVASEE
jgi:Na+-translocating ferredoxin:NAD+ oxidoreductase RNF subunit RnfB